MLSLVDCCHCHEDRSCRHVVAMLLLLSPCCFHGVTMLLLLLVILVVVAIVGIVNGSCCCHFVFSDPRCVMHTCRISVSPWLSLQTVSCFLP